MEQQILDSIAYVESTVLRIVILRVGLNIPVTAGTLLVLTILRDGGPLPVVVKPCTVIANSLSAIRRVARYFSAPLTVTLTLYFVLPIIDSFKYKNDFQGKTLMIRATALKRKHYKRF